VATAGRPRRSTGLTGAVGEYHVAAELSRRDWLATVTIKNSPGTDVLAQRRDRSAVIAVQVKTASPGSHFRLSEKDEVPAERVNEWYVLVALAGELERPRFYVLPRHVVAALAYLEHRAWLREIGPLHGPPRGGRQRKDNPARQIRADWVTGYLENWDLLDQSAWAAPYLGAAAFLTLQREVPLPPAYRPLS
jgi:hypothetical protein